MDPTRKNPTPGRSASGPPARAGAERLGHNQASPGAAAPGASGAPLPASAEFALPGLKSVYGKRTITDGFAGWRRRWLAPSVYRTTPEPPGPRTARRPVARPSAGSSDQAGTIRAVGFRECRAAGVLLARADRSSPIRGRGHPAASRGTLGPRASGAAGQLHAGRSGPSGGGDRFPASGADGSPAAGGTARAGPRRRGGADRAVAEHGTRSRRPWLRPDPPLNETSLSQYPILTGTAFCACVPAGTARTAMSAELPLVSVWAP